MPWQVIFAGVICNYTKVEQKIKIKKKGRWFLQLPVEAGAG